jgi:S-adenosyl methyltransferase
LSFWPETRDLAVDNREFLGRVVRFLSAEAGIDQFIDLGTGLPTQNNVHQVAQRTNPACRVLYADNDPVVRNHADALLVRDGRCAFLTADIRSPRSVLTAPETRAVIDFSRPVGLLAVAVLHFIAADPADLMAEYVAALPAGSYLALSHLTSEGASDELRATVDQVYRAAPSPLFFRSRQEIEAMFRGLPLEEPGLVDVPLWRPFRFRHPGPMRILGGLARKG